MHWNLEQILWALVLAAHLVLLIVLLGRDRSSRFPWFTAAIGFSTVHLIADHLLHGKLTSLAFYWQSYSSILVDMILGLLVLIEICRRIFASCKAGKILNAKGWLGWTLVTVCISIGAVWAWGPWPAWKALSAEPKQLPLLLVVLCAMKGQLFLAILTVEVGLLLQIFGRRFGFGWKSHAQQIGLGLSTYALGFLAVQTTTDIIKRNLHLTSRAQYERIVHLFSNLDNGRFALWFLVLAWWIVWLWRNDPDDPSEPAGTLEMVEAPVLGGLPPLEAPIPEAETDSDGNAV
jgi:hypothetical protein